MKTYKRYSIALNDEENGKLQKVKNHYKETGVKKIFMGMVNAMFSKIPIPSTTDEDETQGDGVNKSGIMRNFHEKPSVNSIGEPSVLQHMEETE